MYIYIYTNIYILKISVEKRKNINFLNAYKK
jgi:hypothetical protein